MKNCSLNKIVEMAPLRLPAQDTAQTLDEVRRMLLVLQPDCVTDAYDSALAQLRGQQLFDSCQPTNDEVNFASAGFEATLKRARTPASYCGCIVYALGLNNSTDTQSRVAASLIHAVARAFEAAAQNDSDPASSAKANVSIEEDSFARRNWIFRNSDTSFEQRQMDTVFATSRITGPYADSLSERHPNARHVIVWSRGYAFAVDVIGKSFHQLQQAVEDIEAASRALPMLPTSVAWMSSNLDRSDWHTLRAARLSDQTECFRTLEAGIVTIALEEYDAASDTTSWMEDLKMNQRSLNRYGDLTTGIVVYKNGQAGMFFDHIGVDGGIAYTVAESLSMEATALLSKFRETKAEAPKTLSAFKPIPFPNPLLSSDYPHSPPTMPVKLLHLKFQSLNPYPLRLHAFMSLTLQLALLKTFNSFQNHLVLEPTSMRHFQNGRVVTTYSQTRESHNLVRLLLDSFADNHSVGNGACDYKAIKQHVQLFLSARNAAIKLRKMGACVGSHFSLIRNAVSKISQTDENASFVNKVWTDALDGAGLCYLTGYDETFSGAVSAAMGSVFMGQQLSVMYVGYGSVIIAGSGRYREHFEELCSAFEWAHSTVAQVLSE
ncbi:hypothetical protein CcCBS67573_g02144 [Chytriomyces confervae]|uniref:Choline/carnitine acyltransferase domain-containing protein n=1 Tax=Chytriomyces confervae TaxID=246404 RepID=A0A507FNJ3_9FUNG|nr:hypothetical protein CcCBS67573_g02144 [Chytriomyces confervae]